MRPLLKRLLGCMTFLALIPVDVCGHNLNGYKNDIRFGQQVKSIPGVSEDVSYKIPVRDARPHVHKLMTMELRLWLGVCNHGNIPFSPACNSHTATHGKQWRVKSQQTTTFTATLTPTLSKDAETSTISDHVAINMGEIRKFQQAKRCPRSALRGQTFCHRGLEMKTNENWCVSQNRITVRCEWAAWKCQPVWDDRDTHAETVSTYI